MPGVPSSRSCEACRKVKKKCDQVKPACSRCVRLKINCIGSGRQRYKFHDESTAFAIVDCQVSRRPATTVVAEFGPIITLPSNKITITAGSLSSVLEVTDPKYDIFCFGTFMKDLPQRLGYSPALDASAAAFVGALRDLRTRQATPNSIRKYVGALNAVQKSLGDPNTAYSAETLCAIFLIMAASPWLTMKGDKYPNHGEGMAQLLKILVDKQPQDDFMRNLIAVVSVVVILENVFNPAITLEPWIHKVRTLASREDEEVAAKLGLNFRSLDMRWLALIPELIRNPKKNCDTIKAYYELIRTDYPGVKSFGDTVIEAKCVGPATSLPLKLVRAQTHFHSAQCLMITIGITFNSFMRKHFEFDDLLFTEWYNFCADAIELAERAKHRRPLAAAHIPMCLIAAWLSSQDPVQHMQLELLMDEYKDDYALIDMARNATYVKEDKTTGIFTRLPCFPTTMSGSANDANQENGPEAYCAEYCNFL